MKGWNIKIQAINDNRIQITARRDDAYYIINVLTGCPTVVDIIEDQTTQHKKERNISMINTNMSDMIAIQKQILEDMKTCPLPSVRQIEKSLNKIINPPKKP